MSSGLDRKASSISVLSNFSNSRIPEEYEVDAAATAGDLVREVLARHRMLSKDPHLLYVTLDVLGQRGSLESVDLKEDARLLQRLQQTQRTIRERQVVGSRLVFVLHMRSGGLLKIHDTCIMPGSFYNSLYVSLDTTATQVIGLLLASYGSREPVANFQLVVKEAKSRDARCLAAGEIPLAVQQQSRGELTIHLRRAEEPAANSPRKASEPLDRSETLARLRESFRDLQRLRTHNPELYHKLVVAGNHSQTMKVTAKSTTARQPSGKPSQFRHSARQSRSVRGGNLSARTTDARTYDNDDDKELGEEEEADVSWFQSRSARQLFASSRSSRGIDAAQQLPQQRQRPQQQPQSKRQLPQLPSEVDIQARRLKLELEAQRHLAASRRDFQCQAFEEAGLLGRTRGDETRPSLREILAACDTRGCQLTRPSRALTWGIRWQELQFSDINGNESPDSPVGHRPAIGKRPGAFQRNERLLKYMRTLVAVQCIAEGGAAAASNCDLRPGDMVVEINGCLATGMAPDQIDGLIDAQLALDILVARRLSAASLTSPSNALFSGPESESGLPDAGAATGDADDLRRRLRELQLRCGELASQCRVSDQVVQRLKSQLTRTARVCLLQHSAEAAEPRSNTDANRSFRVITASQNSPVTSAV